MVPVLMIWGDEDPYGRPEIGHRAGTRIPEARLEVVPGRHAPFLDDPERCGTLINELLAARPRPNPGMTRRDPSASNRRS
jgi:pimeloyl-ACP methyl ester carboxylesterase